MTVKTAADILTDALQAAEATAIEDCLVLLAQLQEGTDLRATLSARQKGQALALEAYAKDLIAAEEGFCARYIRQVLEQVPPGIDFREGLADSLASLGRPREALEQAKELARILPGDLETQLRLVGLLLAVRDVGEARAVLQKFQVALDPAKRRALLPRLRDVDPDEAIAPYAALAVALEPDAESATKALAAVRAVRLRNDVHTARVLLGQAFRVGYDAPPGMRGLWYAVAVYSFPQIPDQDYRIGMAVHDALDQDTPIETVTSTPQLKDRPLVKEFLRHCRWLEVAANGTAGVDQALAKAALAWLQRKVEKRDEELLRAADLLWTGQQGVASDETWDLLFLALRLLAVQPGRPETLTAGNPVIGQFVTRAMAHGHLRSEVLYLWRTWKAGVWPIEDDPEATAVGCWSVRMIVEGTAKRHASDDPRLPKVTGESRVPFAVAYEVAVAGSPNGIANSEMAIRLALEFEEAIGGAAMVGAVLGTEWIGEYGVRRPFGILRRSGRVFHQGDSEESGQTTAAGA